ncbi:hypothetical protein M3P05_00525 [Sansalvadorimonas sp. 2012CJ34-2]|uniref:Uncharacterized protein n=1 Tax=Parendozoicomonas callyspongiae TaxID=2942213 RepID=A0ABT0PAL8_9GAMM|nr:hypothetical protein [Sansalvadorimonas sp. 2012CJ34-2]MCL6268434.1 hypothetical protein [Sansalvadorimonas sp. 2012CJ34-2]
MGSIFTAWFRMKNAVAVYTDKSVGITDRKENDAEVTKGLFIILSQAVNAE